MVSFEKTLAVQPVYDRVTHLRLNRVEGTLKIVFV